MTLSSSHPISTRYNEDFIPITKVLKDMFDEERNEIWNHTDWEPKRQSCATKRYFTTNYHYHMGLKEAKEIDTLKQKEAQPYETMDYSLSTDSHIDDYDESEEGEEAVQVATTEAKKIDVRLRNQEKAVLNIDEIYDREVYKKFSYL
jgi:hypothetical protein